MLSFFCRKFLANRREEEERIKTMGDEERDVRDAISCCKQDFFL